MTQRHKEALERHWNDGKEVTLGKSLIISTSFVNLQSVELGPDQEAFT